MSSEYFGKAVRDKIPDIIRDSGSECSVEVLNELLFYVAMKKKLQEEVDEYKKTPCLEELADIMEVVYKLCEMEGFSIKELERVRLKKREERGGFDRSLYLKEIVNTQSGICRCERSDFIYESD
ncbi:nucleoside triphosphate pyrophosphohydrolase [Methanochimaera problematica]|uniref:nucleoside triphosphate pyrophosphohydrolase n=1 Tax=Methanochimaera problematica TaxID=2609417 RepID=UPI002938E3C5|nr:nucleoside triphosphate pyrophosphohydrolase [Methanoplanus sp. FWC-SCC4]